LLQLFKGYPKAAQRLYLFVKQHTATLQLNNSYPYAPLLKVRRRNFGDQSQTDLFSSKYMSCQFAELLAVIFKASNRYTSWPRLPDHHSSIYRGLWQL